MFAALAPVFGPDRVDGLEDQVVVARLVDGLRLGDRRARKVAQVAHHLVHPTCARSPATPCGRRCGGQDVEVLNVISVAPSTSPKIDIATSSSTSVIWPRSSRTGARITSSPRCRTARLGVALVDRDDVVGVHVAVGRRCRCRTGSTPVDGAVERSFDEVGAVAVDPVVLDRVAGVGVGGLAAVHDSTVFAPDFAATSVGGAFGGVSVAGTV